MGHALGVCGAAIVPLCRAQPNEPSSVTRPGLVVPPSTGGASMTAAKAVRAWWGRRPGAAHIRGMTNTTGTSRVSPGVPTGGQFAAQAPRQWHQCARRGAHAHRG